MDVRNCRGAQNQIGLKLVGKGPATMLRQAFRDRLKEALKARDSRTTSTVRLILAGLKERDVAARGQANPDGLSEAEIQCMLQAMIKQRRESIALYRQGNRDGKGFGRGDGGVARAPRRHIRQAAAGTTPAGLLLPPLVRRDGRGEGRHRSGCGADPPHPPYRENDRSLLEGGATLTNQALRAWSHPLPHRGRGCRAQARRVRVLPRPKFSPSVVRARRAGCLYLQWAKRGR